MDIARNITERVLLRSDLSIRINTSLDAFIPYATCITHLSNTPINILFSDNLVDFFRALLKKRKTIWVTRNAVRTKLELNIAAPIIMDSLLLPHHRYALQQLIAAGTAITAIETIASPKILSIVDTTEGACLTVALNNTTCLITLSRILYTDSLEAPITFALLTLSLLNVSLKETVHFEDSNFPVTTITPYSSTHIIDISSTHALIETIRFSKNMRKKILLICDAQEFEKEARSIYSKLPYQAHLFLTGQVTEETVRRAEQMGFILNKSFFCYKSLLQASYHLSTYTSQEYFIVIASMYADSPWKDILHI